MKSFRLRSIPSKDQRRRVAAMIARGWTATRTASGHVKMTHPSGQVVIVSMTPSDRRGSLNLDSDVRRIEAAASS